MPEPENTMTIGEKIGDLTRTIGDFKAEILEIFGDYREVDLPMDYDAEQKLLRLVEKARKL